MFSAPPFQILLLDVHRLYTAKIDGRPQKMAIPARLGITYPLKNHTLHAASENLRENKLPFQKLSHTCIHTLVWAKKNQSTARVICIAHKEL